MRANSWFIFYSKIIQANNFRSLLFVCRTQRYQIFSLIFFFLHSIFKQKINIEDYKKDSHKDTRRYVRTPPRLLSASAWCRILWHVSNVLCSTCSLSPNNWWKCHQEIFKGLISRTIFFSYTMGTVPKLPTVPFVPSID